MPDTSGALLHLMNPILQWGFAGFSAVLIAIIVWLIRRLLDVLERTNIIITENTVTIRAQGVLSQDQLKLLRSINDKLLARPCIVRGEDGGRRVESEE